MPRERMAEVAEWISYVAPLTYVCEAVDRVSSPEPLDGAFWFATAVIVGLLAVALTLAAIGLPRRTE